MKHVIIGNGVAGLTAAEAIRSLDCNASITILSEEPYHYYSRIRLIDYLAGNLFDEGKLFLKKPEWFAENRIDVHLSCPSERFDATSKVVYSRDGKGIPYDRLLLTVGAQPFLPPLSGIQLPGVYALRTLDDARAIRHAVASRRQVVMLGGGILSLEVAWVLAKAGCRITVVEFFDRLLPRQMDRAGSAMLQGIFERQGMRFYLGARTSAISGNGRAEGVLLTDGTEIACDLVLVVAGVRPDLRLVQASGMLVDRGIVVNDRMETSIPDVYAAGDVTVHRGVLYGIWPAAMAQGRVAGVNMAGGDESFTGMVMSNTLKVAGIDLFALGDIDGEGVGESVVFGDADKGVYRKLVLHNGKAAGAILLGDLSSRAKVQRAVQEERPISAEERRVLGWGDFSILG